MRILIVDDDRAVVTVFREWLIYKGHEVFELQTPVTLAAEVAGGKYDALFLDVNLRVANGLWLIARAHAAAPGMKIFVMSGEPETALKEIALQEGASYYFTKPIDLNIVDRVLQGKTEV